MSPVSRTRTLNIELVADIPYIEAHPSIRILFTCIFTSFFPHMKCVNLPLRPFPLFFSCDITRMLVYT